MMSFNWIVMGFIMTVKILQKELKAIINFSKAKVDIFENILLTDVQNSFICYQIISKIKS
jgi:hypothetical protein